MSHHKIIYKQLKHVFLLHPEYIHHDEIDSPIIEEEEDMEIDEDADYFDNLTREPKQEKQAINPEEFKDSKLYPFFASLDSLKDELCDAYPGLSWEEMPVEEDIQFASKFYYAKIYTEGDGGLLEFIIQCEAGNVYYPLRVESSLTDYPYKAVKKLAAQKNWFIYHLNGFDYLDIGDDTEIANDFISPLSK